MTWRVFHFAWPIFRLARPSPLDWSHGRLRGR